MKWPRTLFGQLLLAVFAGLLVAQSVGAWLMLDDRGRFEDQLRGEFAAQRLANIVAILDRTAPADRARIVLALGEPPNFMTLGEPWRRSDPDNDDKIFSGIFQQALGHPAPLQMLPIEFRSPPVLPHRELLEHGRPRDMPFLVIQTRLADGTVLTLRHSPMPAMRNWPGRTMALLWVLALSVAILAGWGLKRLTRPLAALADAATSLAENLDQAPLTESGPREIARAAIAFNAMQRDLRTLLETRSQALAGVSHDLRLPITRIRLRLEKLNDSDLRARIESDLAEMDGMIGNTLQFLRAGNNGEQAVRLNLDALLESMVEDFEALGTEVRLHGQVGTPVFARPEALRRCLSNLLVNARRYAGGPIDLSVEAGDPVLTLRVEDRGPGIAEADREKVFEPYFRLESSRAKETGGSGLGLAIARTIARAQGGDLKLTSRCGGGLSAILTWPKNPRA
jgi:signal transduction histidine kinase